MLEFSRAEKYLKQAEENYDEEVWDGADTAAAIADVWIRLAQARIQSWQLEVDRQRMELTKQLQAERRELREGLRTKTLPGVGYQ